MNHTQYHSTRNLMNVVARDLRHQASATTTGDIAGVEAWLNKTLEQLVHAHSTSADGPQRVQWAIKDAFHQAQSAYLLLQQGGDTGPLSPGLLVQAHLRVAAWAAWRAGKVLDECHDEAKVAALRQSRAKVAEECPSRCPMRAEVATSEGGRA